jgi:hypothetical protein
MYSMCFSCFLYCNCFWVLWGRIRGRNWDKRLAIHIHLYKWILSPPPFPVIKSGLKLVCNDNIAYRNFKSENSQDYAQKSQQNSLFMNSAWIHNALKLFIANGSLKYLEALENRAKATRPWKNTRIISIWLCVCISWLNLEDQIDVDVNVCIIGVTIYSVCTAQLCVNLGQKNVTFPLNCADWLLSLWCFLSQWLID